MPNDVSMYRRMFDKSKRRLTLLLISLLQVLTVINASAAVMLALITVSTQLLLMDKINFTLFFNIEVWNLMP